MTSRTELHDPRPWTAVDGNHDPAPTAPPETEAERQISETCGWYASPPVRRTP
jgi:hypothetical protein